MRVRFFWAVRYASYWNRSDDVPIIKDRGIEGLRASGDVPLHCDQVIRHRAVDSLDLSWPDIGGVIKTARDFSAEDCQ